MFYTHVIKIKVNNVIFCVDDSGFRWPLSYSVVSNLIFRQSRMYDLVVPLLFHFVKRHVAKKKPDTNPGLAAHDLMGIKRTTTRKHLTVESLKTQEIIFRFN